MNNKWLFVYGTLRKNNAAKAHPLLQHCIYQAEGYIHAKLYLVQDYPGAVLSWRPQDKVYGELYHVPNPSMWLSLDTYEECSAHFPWPQEYNRQLCTVTVSDKRGVAAWVYIYNRQVTALTWIPSGNYRNYKP